jgi:hypothetical protein
MTVVPRVTANTNEPMNILPIPDSYQGLPVSPCQSSTPAFLISRIFMQPSPKAAITERTTRRPLLTPSGCTG